MYVVSKNGDSIVNLDNIKIILLCENDTAIKVYFSDGRGCQIAVYDSKESTLMAIKMLSNNIATQKIYKMPSDDEVKMKIISENKTSNQRIKGKKVKDHGKS